MGGASHNPLATRWCSPPESGRRIALVWACASALLASFVRAEPRVDKPYPDSGGFDDEIRAFEDADRNQFPPRDAIVCIGSSSMKGWHHDIDEDLAPLTIVARGFGGSNMNDALHYADRIVIPYAPRAVVLYEGDNDVAQGISPLTILDTFQAFVAGVREALPGTRFYVVSIKPSIDRWTLWPQMEAANQLLAEQCARDETLTYIDVATGMLDAKGNPRKDIFLSDDLHMNRAGYDVWRDAVRPILIPAESPHESAPEPASSQ